MGVEHVWFSFTSRYLIKIRECLCHCNNYQDTQINQSRDNYMIYHLTGHEEKAKYYINLCYNDIMSIASKLRKDDRKNFLKNHVMISKVMSIWEQYNI